MPEPTASRQTLRRAIGLAAGMQFYKRYPSGQVALTAADTTAYLSVTSSDLTQNENFWRGKYVYIVETGAERRINAFSADADKLIFEYPGASTDFESSDSIEITDFWSPGEIHGAINRSIQIAGKNWPDVIKDETHILEEDKLAYLLDTTEFTTAPWQLLQLWIESPSNDVRYSTATGSFNHYLQDSDDLSNITATDVGKLLSIYHGAGSGALRTVNGADSTTGVFTTTVALTTDADSTSLYCIWDPNEQVTDWVRMADARTDMKEYPDYLYLSHLPSALYGMRMRLIYTAESATLSADTDTTVIPQEYIVNKALSLLHERAIGDNAVDRQEHIELTQYYAQRADEYLSKMYRRLPAGTRWLEGSPGTGAMDYQGDPLGWRS